MTLTFDQKTYCNLLTEITPVAIETEEEYERVLKLVEQRLSSIRDLQKINYPILQCVRAACRFGLRLARCE